LPATRWGGKGFSFCANAAQTLRRMLAIRIIGSV
jgi:hypothetical protein